MIRTAFSVPRRAVEISHGKVYGSTYSRHIPKQNPMVQPIHKVTIFQFWSEPTSERNSWANCLVFWRNKMGPRNGWRLGSADQRNSSTKACAHGSERSTRKLQVFWAAMAKWEGLKVKFLMLAIFCVHLRMLLLEYITKQQISCQTWIHRCKISPFSRSESLILIGKWWWLTLVVFGCRML